MDSYFITGGTGTLGKAILERLDLVSKDTYRPRVTVFSRDPMRQAQMPHYPNLDVNYVMGDVNDYDAVQAAMAGHSLVIHAAAMKHIPQGESQVKYTLDVNIGGSYNVAKAALVNKVEVATCISTDKVCYPINVYGLSKLAMENIWREFATMQNNVAYTSCRYGNVLGSNGSVLQVWKRQSDDGQPITITDPDHIRYWMTTHDAVNVVLEAVHGAPSGVTVIPVAPSLSILGLARLVTGKELSLDDVSLIGTRPGEKEIEWLLTREECSRAEGVKPTRIGFTYIYLHPYKAGSGKYNTRHMSSDDAIDAQAVAKKLKQIGVIA